MRYPHIIELYLSVSYSITPERRIGTRMTHAAMRRFDNNEWGQSCLQRSAGKNASEDGGAIRLIHSPLITLRASEASYGKLEL